MFLLILAAWCVLLALSLITLRSDVASRRVGMWFALGLPVIFLGHWMSASSAIPVLVWIFWLGDRNHWFWDHSEHVTAVIAIVITAFVAARVMLWRAGTRYAAINCLGAVIMLILLGALHGYWFVQQIEGWSAESAARNIASRYTDLAEQLRLTREPTEQHFPARRCITFRGSDASGPRCRITVCRHGAWWWKQGAMHWFPPRQQELARAKEWLKTNPRDAPLILEEIVRNYPETHEASEAKRLLRRR